ncbi:MAG: NFACT family protein [Oscillospiraceae bacterium]|nr:NFACT family protein [Oscillospiraceae bacterium]
MIMRFDHGFIHYLCIELQQLVGTRVDKIHQPGRDELVLHLRSREGNFRLLICVNQARMRAGLITTQPENPPQPTMFCMLLRKHLTGAKITAITKPPHERMLRFALAGTNEIGVPTRLSLIAEFTGRRANIIVVREDGTVLDAIRRVDFSQSTRAILPGLPYEMPPNPTPPPSELTPPDIGDSESLSRYLELHFEEADRAQRQKQRTAELLKLCETRAARSRRRADTQARDLAAAADREHLRVAAELILANQHALERGATAYCVENYYDENRPLTIAADPALSPAQNAQRYYKKHGKAKRAAQLLGELIAQAQAEADYLDSVADALQRAETLADVNAIRAELEQQGFLKAKAEKKAAKREKTAAPVEYRTSAGLRVLAGRNNVQNDHLTFKLARGHDLWLHVKDYPGSHVVLFTEGQQPSEQCITQAAEIAAWHSKIRSRAAVSYTPVKSVKKFPGAAPGQVILHSYQTVIADPSLEKMEALHGRN